MKQTASSRGLKPPGVSASNERGLRVRVLPRVDRRGGGDGQGCAPGCSGCHAEGASHGGFLLQMLPGGVRLEARAPLRCGACRAARARILPRSSLRFVLRATAGGSAGHSGGLNAPLAGWRDTHLQSRRAATPGVGGDRPCSCDLCGAVALSRLADQAPMRRSRKGRRAPGCLTLMVVGGCGLGRNAAPRVACRVAWRSCGNVRRARLRHGATREIAPRRAGAAAASLLGCWGAGAGVFGRGRRCGVQASLGPTQGRESALCLGRAGPHSRRGTGLPRSTARRPGPGRAHCVARPVRAGVSAGVGQATDPADTGGLDCGRVSALVQLRPALGCATSGDRLRVRGVQGSVRVAANRG
mmetsp:Transcript_23253/g.88093  ORF Transcript_23253/g.88093 Transcript_23253/m.88093 type:complete len:356 (-) Transcript_23253:281-1348(-)